MLTKYESPIIVYFWILSIGKVEGSFGHYISIHYISSTFLRDCKHCRNIAKQ